MRDWFTHDVEAGVQNKRNPRQLVKMPDQPVVAWIPAFPYRLETPCAIVMHNPRHFIPYGRSKPQRALHVGTFLVVLEIIMSKLMQNGWGKRPVFLAKLDATVDFILYVWTPGISQDRPIPQ